MIIVNILFLLEIVFLIFANKIESQKALIRNIITKRLQKYPTLLNKFP